MPFDEEKTEVRSIEVPGMMVLAEFTLGGQGRTVKFSLPIDAGVQDDQLDDMLDRLSRAAERVAAKYGLPDKRRKLQIATALLEDNLRRKAATEDELQGFRNKRMEDARKIENERSGLYDALYLQHHQKGYQGEFAPRGADAQQLKRMDEAIAQLQQPVGGREAELIGNLTTLENEIRNGEAGIAWQKSILDEDERIARGEDVSGV